MKRVLPSTDWDRLGQGGSLLELFKAVTVFITCLCKDSRSCGKYLKSRAHVASLSFFHGSRRECRCWQPWQIRELDRLDHKRPTGDIKRSHLPDLPSSDLLDLKNSEYIVCYIDPADQTNAYPQKRVMEGCQLWGWNGWN